MQDTIIMCSLDRTLGGGGELNTLEPAVCKVKVIFILYFERNSK